MISQLNDENFSDLNPEEIPNSDLSDISDSEFQQQNEDAINQINAEESLDLKIELQKTRSDKYIEQNHEFMKSFT